MIPKITIIIIHWNTPDLLYKQIKILSKDANFQIIVVDNASEKLPLWIQTDFPQIELIQNKHNRGYAFACNQGTVKGVGEWLLFLNPDTEITPEQIIQMVNYAKREKLDACSPISSENYQKPLPSLFSLLAEFTPLNKFSLHKFFKQQSLFGGCLLIKTEVIKYLGGWDERFFLWFEDSDLTKRLLDNKYKISRVPIHIVHQGGASFDLLNNHDKTDIFFHSMDVYAKKHFSYIDQCIISLLKKKYSNRKILSKINDLICITVPNIQKKLLEEFFVKNESFISAPDIEYIIISSSLNSKSIWLYREKYPGIRFISINKNQGFAKTVNIGFRVSSGKWIGTMNDDVILSENWIQNLIKDIDVKKIGSINPVINQINGDIESVGIEILPKGKALPKKTVPQTDLYSTTDATNAACVLYSKESLNQVGLFDEKFGSYLEDIDLSLRLKRAGYKNIVSLKSAVTHLGQSSSCYLGVQKQYFDFRNWIYVILKNWGFRKLLIYCPSILLERSKNFFGIIKAILQHKMV